METNFNKDLQNIISNHWKVYISFEWVKPIYGNRIQMSGYFQWGTRFTEKDHNIFGSENVLHFG